MLDSHSFKHSIMRTRCIELAAFLFFFTCLFFSTLAYSQDTDSLKLKLEETTDLDEKYNIYLQIAYNYWYTNTDSSKYYLNKAIQYATTSEREVKVMMDVGLLFNEIQLYDSALATFTHIFNRYEKELTLKNKAKLFGNIGNSYSYKGYLTKATEQYQKAATIFEEINDSVDMATVYGTLGNIYFENNNYKEAIRHYIQSKNLFKELQYFGGYGLNLMNIGTSYKNQNKSDTALFFYQQALHIFDSLGNMPFQKAQCMANLGNLFASMEKLQKAEKYLIEAESVFLKHNTLYSVAQINQDLAYIYLKMNLPNLAKEKIDKSSKLIEENGYNILLLGTKRLLWEYYDTQNNCDSALFWFTNYISFKDSIDSFEKEKNLDILLAQFDSERKEKQIVLLKQKQEISQLKIRRRTLIFFITIIGFAVSIAFIISLYITNKKRRKANKLLTFQNGEIIQQKEEIVSQRDEIESQRDLLQNQNDLLEQFRTHTTESLRYAQSIQAAILPSEKVLQQISPDYFVLMKPCEIVSGDFFWATSFDNYHIFCVADCTGHGVPGAFMSILGITALNDIVARHRVTKPSEILGFLRESVIDALKQNDPEQLHKDGMDIALCSYNEKTKELQFAGGGIPLLIASSTKLETDMLSNPIATNEFGQSLYEVKGNIMPVGSSPRMKPFTNITIPLKSNSAYLYLVTDGFQDQMGGKHNKKFGVKTLRDHLLTNANHSPKVQHDSLNTVFEDWKKGKNQIDDVTILGIKL